MRSDKDFVTVAEQLADKVHPIPQFVIYRRVSTMDRSLERLGMEA